MSKIPKNNQYNKRRISKTRNASIKNSDPYLNLLEDWDKVLLSNKLYRSKHLRSVINFLTGHISEDMPKEAILISRLSHYDEQIFEYYMDIINCYKSIVKSYEKISENLQFDDTKNILNGVLTVVLSRLREYQDLKIESCNPIYFEKKKIIDMYVSKFTDEAYFLCESDMSIEGTDEDILSFLYEKFFITLYTSYNRHLGNCIKALDRIEERTTLDTYQNLLKQEEDVFKSIIKIQINELEKQQSDSETLEELFYIIREAYQRLRKNMDDLEILQKESSTNLKNNKKTFESFENYLKDMLIKEHKIILSNVKPYKDQHEMDKIAFSNSLEKSLVKFAKRLKHNEKEYDIETILNSVKINNEKFAKNMIDIFSSIISYTISHESSLVSFEREFKIISGVTETLNIKIESIKENFNSFSNDISEISGNIKLPENLCSEITKLWKDEFSDMKAINKKVESFFNLAIKDNFYNFDAINLWLNEINLIILDIKKKDLNFKKEHLLFEITTFEDLINHSISRLKDSATTEMLMYVQVVEEANSQINTMLLNNNITPIIPEPHSLFSGKEHEVIMAERKEGFKKGEIIKVTNSGYREGDKVIVRASVIAAK